jgi:lipoate-protein ligase A
MPIPVCFWHHAADPFFNMAFDDAMLEQVLRNPQSIFLRLYTWNQGAITIGVNQKPERAVLTDRLGGTPLIRRSTGGRAVYHDVSELTYSMALNTESVFLTEGGTSPSTIYLKLAEGLRLFLEELGISTQVVRRSGANAREAVHRSVKSCFASTARYELVTGNLKVLASAQRQIGTNVLQHGSIKLHGAVSHQALPDIPPACCQSVQPLGRSEIEGYARVFGNTLSSVIGAPDFSLSSSSDPFPGITDRLKKLLENPLAKRDLY